MESSCIVLHNCLYPSSEILMQNLKTLLDKLNISVASTQKIALENKFLPCVNPIAYYQSLIKILKTAQRDEQRLLVCDSQSLLEITRLFKIFYENAEFREAMQKACGENIDMLELENTFAFAPEVILGALKPAMLNKGRWNGFKCAFILDRELQDYIKESQIIPQIESLTGLKILPFFKESYAYLLQTNPQLAYKMGGMDYYEMMDCGVDFIMSANIGNFELMDRQIRNLQNALGRDTAEIPLLFIPQVILALFSDASTESLKFGAHTIKPKML